MKRTLKYFKEVHQSEEPYWFVISNEWRNSSLGIPLSGWGNGYVAIPKWHPWYEVDYFSIPCVIHYGLTYGKGHADMWVIGFDTAHGGDTLRDWPKIKVVREAQQLWKQVMEWDWTAKIV